MNRIPRGFPLGRTVYLRFRQTDRNETRGEDFRFLPEEWTVLIDRAVSTDRRWAAYQNGIDYAMLHLRSKQKS